VFLNSNLTGALDRIAERAADVRRAYTPGAVPIHDDVAAPGIISDFTLDPLAVVAPEGSYFVSSDGGEKRIYTRDGAFSVRGGLLVNAEGQPILGLHAGSALLADLRVDPIDDALGRVRDLAIDRDGTLTYRREYRDPRSGNREHQRIVVGTVVLARFPAGTRLVAHDGGGCTAPENVAAQISRPEEDGFPPLEPMRRERGRIDVDASLVRLKEAYLAFDALQAAEAAKAHVGKTAMDLLK
jgi:flagellar basal body rod protein FlgG